MATYKITGAVTNQNGQPEQGVVLRATLLHSGGEKALSAPTVTGENGIYDIEYDSKSLIVQGKESAAVYLVLRAIDRDGNLLAKSKPQPVSEEADKQLKINLTIGTDSKKENVFVVRGKVSVGDKATENIAVAVFEKDLPSKANDTALGVCQSDIFGHYYIPYIPSKTGEGASDRTDVYVQIAETAHSEVYQSDTLYHAGRDTVLDVAPAPIIVTGEVKPEFDRYLETLKPMLGTVAIEDMSAEDQAFLHQKTGIDAAHLEYLRRAHQWANEVKNIPAPAFYALLRAGFPADPSLWIDKKEEAYKTALAQAVKDKVIPAASDVIEDLIKFAAHKSVLPDDTAQTSPMAVVLKSVLSDKLQLQLTEDFIKHDATKGDFWTEAETNETYGQHIPRIRFGLDVSALTLQNEALTQMVLASVSGQDAPTTVDLVAMSPEDWKALMVTESTDKPFDFPPSIPGKDIQEKQQNYANQIVETVERKFPAAAVVRELKKTPVYHGAVIWDTIKEESKKKDFDILKFDTSRLNEATDAEKEVKAHIKALQEEVRAYPAYAYTIKESQYWVNDAVKDIPPNTTRKSEQEFFETSGYNFKQAIGFYLQNPANKAFTGAFTDTVKAAVEKKYRLYGIGGDARTADALARTGKNGAADILRTPDGVLAAELEPLGVPPETVPDIKDRAGSVDTTATYVAQELYIHFNHTNPRVMGNNRETLKLAQTTGGRSADAPVEYGPGADYNVLEATYENLFGSMSTCACDHCRSVYGPAAYFVDFLHNLLGGKTDAGNSPADFLLQRRPDLQYLKLNCKNTDTRIPYIDLVNEILEIYIAHGNLHQESLLRSSTRTAEELAKEPEFLIEEAYRELNAVVYPLSLPFDKNLMVVQTYLTEAGTSWYEALQRAGETEERKLVSAIIGLSDLDYEILTNPYERFYKILSGYEPDALQSLKNKLLDIDLWGGGDKFNHFLASLKNHIGLIFKDVEIERFYNLIKDLHLSDRSWKVFKNIFLEPDSEQIIISPAILYGFADFNEHSGALKKFDLAELGRVVPFLKRVNISMDELDKLVQTKTLQHPIKSDLSASTTAKPGDLFLKWTVLDPDHDDACEIENLVIRYVAGDALSEVADTHFVRINRFIRLWKKLGCTIEELDDILFGWREMDPARIKFDVEYINEGALLHLAYASLLNNRLGWPYKIIAQLFVNEQESKAAAALKTSAKNALAKKLGITAAELEQSREIQLETPQSVYESILKLDRIRQAGFKLSELAYLTGEDIEGTNKMKPAAEEVLDFAKKLRDGLRKVALDTVAPGAFTADFMLEKLKLVYEEGMLKTFADFFNGKIITEAPLALVPGEVFPNDLDNRLRYADGKITFEGFFNAGLLEQALDVLKATEVEKPEKDVRNIPFQKIGTAIRLFPEVYGNQKTKTIDTLVSIQPPFFSEADRAGVEAVFSNFEQHTPEGDQAAFKIIFDKLYAYLTDTFLAQLVSNTFKLDAATTKFLIHTIHPSWEAELKTDFIDVPPANAEKTWLWLTPPKTENYTFSTEILFEGLDKPREQDIDKSYQLVAGKYYKIMGNAIQASTKWSAPTIKEGTIAEQYLFSQATFGDIEKKIIQFEKFALLVQKIKLQSEEIAWMLKDKGFGDFKFATASSFNFQTWQRLADYAFLKKGLQDDDGEDLLTVFHLASATPTDTGAIRKQLLYLTQWKDTNLDAVMMALNTRIPDDFTNEIHILQLYRLQQFRDKYGFLPSLLRSDLTKTVSDAVKDGVLSKYDGETRNTLQKLAEDKLRGLRRDALVAYLLYYKQPKPLQKATIKGTIKKPDRTTAEGMTVTVAVGLNDFVRTDNGEFTIEIDPGRYSVLCFSERGTSEVIPTFQVIDLMPGQVLTLEIILRRPDGSNINFPTVHSPLITVVPRWENINGLYEHFLIDVEMEPLATTSRIVQANATLQLFAQRVLMNLEKEVPPTPDRISQTWYDWMHKYRVWEANRKVFLYPENWIEPELRDDKSELFKALESEMLQGEITHENAVKAVGTYLYALDGIARLDVRAFCEEIPDETKPDQKILHVVARTFDVPYIYYYRWRSAKGVWAPWEKIDVDITDNAISLVVQYGKLYLFWLIFQDKTKKINQDDREYYEIKLAWSEYSTDKKWNKTKKSKISFDNPKELLIYDLFHILTEQRIDIYSFSREGISAVNSGAYALFNNQRENYYIDTSFFAYGLLFIEINAKTKNKTSVIKFGTLLFSEFSEVRKVIIDYKSFYESFNNIPYGLPGTIRIKTVQTNQLQELGEISIENLKKIELVGIVGNIINVYYYDGGYIKDANGNRSLVFNDSRIETVNNPNLPVEGICFFYNDDKATVVSMQKRGNDGNINFYLSNFYHLFSKQLTQTFDRHGVKVFSIKNQMKTIDIEPFRSSSNLIKSSPKTGNDFNELDAYSSYNWELFFHIPMLTANRLSQNQRYQEAQQWYHYIFNPTTTEAAPADGQGGVSRFWQFLPFRSAITESHESIVDILLKLHDPDERERDNVSDPIATWRSDPFNPHAIARKRIQAYMRNVVGKYIENLINWGDSLFRQDSMESINEATQLYMLAANILGPRPAKIPRSGASGNEHNYKELWGLGIDDFGLAMENYMDPSMNSTNPDERRLRANLFYFCIPDNTFILKYWDTVADRLFKIRHSQNIEGIERQLDLFEPEIDPALLVRARAMGMDIGSILRDMQTPMPYYRFNVMLQKALELCAELKGLGSNLLSAIEKKEAEALSMLRQRHEVQMLDLISEIKRSSIQELRENLNSTTASLASAEKKFDYYSTRPKMSALESSAQLMSSSAHASEMTAQGFSSAASIAFAVPQFHAQGTATGTSTGGQQVGKVLEAYASFYKMVASQYAYESSMMKTMADYDRRKEDWDFQKDLASIEKTQIARQILAAEIRINIAEKELTNHEQQIENTRQIEDFLRSKFSSQELYGWMEREVKTLYNQCYQMVYDYAKRTEKTYRHELGLESTDFIRFGAWDSNRNGLLAGERLHVALKQMEKAYLDNNKREYEITKHISLALLDPLALIRLRATGVCDFEIPEALFDLDFAGHYFRRIKSVSVSLPCIAGPYTSVSAKLSLTASKYRKNTNPADNDDNFIQVRAAQSIATSNAQNDSGVFELNFRDERYLPFEGAGAISTWRLELPQKELSQFNYDTIGDVVVHLKYTAREGGSSLKKAAEGALKDQLKLIKQHIGEGLHLAVSLKHDMPNEWHLLMQSGEAVLKIDKSRLPYMVQLLEATIDKVMFFVKGSTNTDSIAVHVNKEPNDPSKAVAITLTKMPGWGEIWQGEMTTIALDAPFKMSMVATKTNAQEELAAVEDLILVVKYDF